MAKKVLVVEDDSNIAELLRLYLEKDGFDVFLAADGGEGIRRAQELQPDLILLDIMLPVVDGWVVCSEVRKTSQCADHHADREGRNVRQDLRT